MAAAKGHKLGRQLPGVKVVPHEADEGGEEDDGADDEGGRLGRTGLATENHDGGMASQREGIN